MEPTSTVPIPRPLSPRNHDLYLDWLRGLAAVLVFLTHVRGGYFVKWGDLDPASQTHINLVLFFLTRLGREAVIIFFVLSGALVGGQALIDYQNRRYSFRRYAAARLARLYVVIAPALLLTALFDFMHNAWNPAKDGLTSLLVNLVFLQEIYGPPYGSNYPLWSLSYEWWFYVLFGFGVLTAAGASFRTRVLSVVVVGASGLMLLSKCPSILLMFPLWLLGVVTRVLPTTQLSGKVAVPLSVAVLSLAMGYSSTRWDWTGDALVGIATMLFIYLCRNVAPSRYPLFSSAGKKLAAFSFSLYALHYPLNYLVERFLIPHRLRNAGVANWMGLVALAIAEGTVCYFFYWIFERHTPAVRAWLNRFLASPSRGSPPAVV
jgi:peptidoglycan/LPS O-acetylase OafA/YrhL